MDLIVKPILTNPFGIIPISIIVRDAIDAVTFAIWFPAEGVVIIWGVIVAVFYTSVLKASGSIEEFLITIRTGKFNAIRILLDIRKNLIADLTALHFIENRQAYKKQTK